MPYELLQYVVGRALVDPSFQTALLATPEQALESLQLTEEERRVLVGDGGGDSLQKVARRVDAWVAANEHKAEARAARHAPVHRSAFDGFDEFPDTAPKARPAREEVSLRKSA